MTVTYCVSAKVSAAVLKSKLVVSIPHNVKVTDNVKVTSGGRTHIFPLGILIACVNRNRSYVNSVGRYSVAKTQHVA